MASPFISCILDMQKFLAQKVGVCDVKLFTHLPAERASISEWERRNLCVLPDDLKSFYLTSDGVQFSWSSKCGEVKTPVGRININAVANLAPIRGHVDPTGDKVSFLDLDASGSEEEGREDDACPPSVGCVGCRAFQLEACEHSSSVCLVFRHCRPGLPAANPEVWLLDRAFRWQRLVGSFTHYYRLLLMHAGLPHWQHLFAGGDVPPHCQQWYNLYAPLRLEMDLFTLPLASSADNDPDKSPLDASRVFKTKAAEKKKLGSGQAASVARGKRASTGPAGGLSKSQTAATAAKPPAPQKR